MLRRFSENSRNPLRAVQIWQILVSKAHNRQTMTYGNVADLIGYKSANPIGGILEYIMDYCEKNDLPPLTVLVVRHDTGLPGYGLSTSTDYHADREKVFNYDWYDIIPPTEEDFSKVG